MNLWQHAFKQGQKTVLKASPPGSLVAQLAEHAPHLWIWPLALPCMSSNSIISFPVISNSCCTGLMSQHVYGKAPQCSVLYYCTVICIRTKEVMREFLSCLTHSARRCLQGPGWQIHWTETPHWQPSWHPRWHVYQWETGPALWLVALPPVTGREEKTSQQLQITNTVCNTIFIHSLSILVWLNTGLKIGCQTLEKTTHTHLLLFDMASRKVNIYSVLVIDDPPDPGHRCIEKTFLLIQCPFLLSIW